MTERPPDERVADSLAQALGAVGVPDDEIQRAARDGQQALVALFADRALIRGKERLTREEVARRAGIDLEDAIAFWRALGFADVPPDERAFTEADVDVLRRLADAISSGIVRRDIALQTTRAMGRAVAQIAAALVDTIGRGVELDGEGPPPALLAAAPMLLEDIERWLVYVLRRHIAAEAKRAAIQAVTSEVGTAVVGFADLVGFTGLSKSMDQAALASAVSTFESLAVDLVGRHDARIVKMIGDEVMFEAPTARAGAEIALDIVDAFASSDELPDVRVGLASGEATRLQGDLFGEAPNLASRLVDEAYPGTVLVSDSIRDSLPEEEGFTFRSVRPHFLKGFGLTRYWVLRREGDERPRRLFKIPFLET